MKDRAKGRKTCKQGRIVAKNGQNIYNKSMKKVISVALVAILIVTTALTFTGCNITNNGSEDELKGIYDVTTMYYKSFEGKKYNVFGQYEYFLLVLNGDEGRTGKVIMKRAAGRNFCSRYHEKGNADI